METGNDANCSATDQRGILRPRGTHRDRGAYEVQPDALTYLSAGGYDGWVLESTENSNRDKNFNSIATTLRVGDDGGNRQYRSALSFDTFVLPDNNRFHSIMDIPRYKIRSSKEADFFVTKK